MKLKVFGWNRGGTQRAIVAATSWKAAAEAASQPLHSFRNWGAITANADEIRLAMAAPGIVFYRPMDQRGMDQWKALE